MVKTDCPPNKVNHRFKSGKGKYHFGKVFFVNGCIRCFVKTLFAPFERIIVQH